MRSMALVIVALVIPSGRSCDCLKGRRGAETVEEGGNRDTVVRQATFNRSSLR